MLGLSTTDFVIKILKIPNTFLIKNPNTFEHELVARLWARGLLAWYFPGLLGSQAWTVSSYAGSGYIKESMAHLIKKKFGQARKLTESTS